MLNASGGVTIVRLIAHYDGKTIVPDEPVQLPTGVPLQVTVQAPEQASGADPIAALTGLGKEVWNAIDPVEYQRREREGWE